MYDDGVAGGCVWLFFRGENLCARHFCFVSFLCTNKEGLDSRGNMSRRPK